MLACIINNKYIPKLWKIWLKQSEEGKKKEQSPLETALGWFIFLAASKV